LGDSLIRIGVGVHALASLAFWILQPRGFAFGSRSFVEHQVLAPAIFAVSAAAVAAGLMKRPPVLSLAVAILAGFWIASGGVISVLGTTAFSVPFWVVPPVAALMLVPARRHTSLALLTGGAVAGLGLAALFWICTWAPAATTRPRGGEIQREPTNNSEGSAFEAEGIQLSISGTMVLMKSGAKTAVLRPGFEYEAVSDRGLWSLFDFRSTSTPSWSCGRSPKGGLALRAENEDFESAGRVWIEKRVVHLRCETRVKRELATHLSSVLQLGLWGPAAVNGVTGLRSLLLATSTQAPSRHPACFSRSVMSPR